MSNSPASAPDAPLADARWLPHRLLDNGRTVHFVDAPRDVHRAATFLDDEGLKSRPARALPVEALRAVRGASPAGFVFHSAFCCSTLLARALDLPGAAMGLKEPAILNDLAELQRAGRGISSILPAVLALLGRPFAPGERVVVKPSNVANMLIEPLLAAAPDTRAILLHAPLRDFLLSVAGKGLWGRIWMRRLYAMLRGSPAFEPGFGDADLFAQSDLQIAALAWLQQQKQFAALLPRLGERLRTLDSATLLARRDEVLVAVAAHLRLPADSAAMLRSRAFAEHAKRLGERYDADRRATEKAAADLAHAEEIGMVETWAIAIARQFAIPLALDRPLVPRG